MATDCKWLVAFSCRFSFPPDLRVPYVRLLGDYRLLRCTPLLSSIQDSC